MGMSSNKIFVLVLTLFFSLISIGLTIEGPIYNSEIDEGVVISNDIVNSTFSNSTNYWGPYIYTLFADYTDWNSASTWGDHALAGYLTDRWLQGTPTWIYNDSNTLYFNTSKLETKYYNATEAEAITGTIDDGTLENTKHSDGNYDGISFNFSEQSGSPGLDMRMNFTNVSDFNGGVIRYKTNDLAGDHPIIQLWSYDSSEWEDYPQLSESMDGFSIIAQQVYDSTDHLVGGRVMMRLYKEANGNTNNEYYIDWVALTQGFGTPSGEEVDPYSWHRNIVGENGNFTTSGDLEIASINITENITNQNFTQWQNESTINLDGGGKDICIGNCS